jgi:hypothetical protein
MHAGVAIRCLKTFACPVQEQQSTWLPQAVQLCQLCCLGVAPPSAESDPVLDAAATRLLQLMTSQQYWAPHQDGNDVERGSRNSSSAAAVLHGIMVQPMPLLQATRRMVTNGSVAGQPQAAAAAQLTPAAVTASGGCSRGDELCTHAH